MAQISGKEPRGYLSGPCHTERFSVVCWGAESVFWEHGGEEGARDQGHLTPPSWEAEQEA